MKLLRMLGIALIAVAAVGVASAQSWQPVTEVPGYFGAAGAIALLTDGRILVTMRAVIPVTRNGGR